MALDAGLQRRSILQTMNQQVSSCRCETLDLTVQGPWRLINYRPASRTGSMAAVALGIVSKVDQHRS